MSNNALVSWTRSAVNGYSLSDWEPESRRETQTNLDSPRNSEDGRCPSHSGNGAVATSSLGATVLVISGDTDGGLSSEEGIEGIH